jgi:hypothetical protein
MPFINNLDPAPVNLSDLALEFDPSQPSREASIAINVTGVTDSFIESIIETMNRQDKE